MAAMAAPLRADDAAALAGWRAWAAEVGVEQSAIAILRDGAVTAEAALGAEAQAAFPIQSVSKTITGACVMALVDEGLVALDSPLSEVFAARPDLLPAGAEAGAVTIAGLLTHSAGIWPDSTQNIFDVMQETGDVDRHDEITTRALARSRVAPDHRYNNENYAILGSVIAEVTGQSVAEACTARVLPRLASAAPDAKFGGGLAYGGWGMSMADLVRFGGGLTARADWPSVEIGHGVNYGPGVLMRETAAGLNLWHYGMVCLPGGPNGGAVLFALTERLVLAVSYDRCLTDTQAVDIERQVLIPALE
jgi:CubicO group peptidase (beta-lactamase class C family)